MDTLTLIILPFIASSNSGPQLGWFLSLWGHLAISEDIFGCDNWGRCYWYQAIYRAQNSPLPTISDSLKLQYCTGWEIVTRTNIQKFILTCYSSGCNKEGELRLTVHNCFYGQFNPEIYSTLKGCLWNTWPNYPGVSMSSLLLPRKRHRKWWNSSFERKYIE